jgi:gluconokinase
MSQNIPLTDEDRAGWLLTLKNLIEQNIHLDQSIVLACSALKNSYRAMLMVSEPVKFIFLRGTYDLIKSRLQHRPRHYMSAKMLASQFDILEEPHYALTIDITQTPQEIITIIRTGLSI